MNKDDIHKTIEEFASQSGLELTKLNNIDLLEYRVDKDRILDLLNFLKESKLLRFTVLTDLFGADFPSRSKRFEVTYNLLSLELNARLIIKVNLVEGEVIPSSASVFSAACWYEREVFDMFGVMFEHSPDLRRILTDYGFVGHPLRKDFPVTGHLEVKYDEKMERVIYQPVVLEQEFRMFDLGSPWYGPDYVLPGDEKATVEAKK